MIAKSNSPSDTEAWKYSPIIKISLGLEVVDDMTKDGLIIWP